MRNGGGIKEKDTCCIYQDVDDSLVRDTLDSCLVQVNSPMHLDSEHLMYPQNLVHDLGLRVDLSEDGIVISGTSLHDILNYDIISSFIIYIYIRIVSCKSEELMNVTT